MNPDLLCMGCMEELAGGAFCRHCGCASDEPAASPLHLPPRTVLHNQYVLGRALGHGGFGITYLAWDMNLARRLAVKEYLPSGMGVRGTASREVSAYSGQADAFKWGLEKFLEEARVLARFQNQPGIVAVLNFFRENGTAYLVMEYLDGITFHEYLTRNNGKIAPAAALRIMTPVMNALREVHKSGVLHRDISPDNIYLCDSGQVKVLDFGAARYALSQQSRSLSIILKEGYAPEEQYRTKGNQGPWTDVYATAATLYRAITGVIPPPALDRKESDELLPPSALSVPIDSDLEQALLKGMAIRAADRFASMEEFQAAIAKEAGAAISSAPVSRFLAEGGRDSILHGTAPGGETRAMRVPTGDETRPMGLVAGNAKAPPAPQTGDETRPIRLPIGGETPPFAAMPGGETRPLPRSGANGITLGPPQQKQALPAPDLNSERNRAKAAPDPIWKRAPKWLIAALAVILAGLLFIVFHKKATDAAPAIQSFRAEKNRIQAGEKAILMWNVDGNADVTLDPGGTPVPRFGNYEVQPKASTTYTLSARNKYGIDAQKVTIEVAARSAPVTPERVPAPKRETREQTAGSSDQASSPVQPVPTIQAFSIEPGTIHRGESANLRWSVANATKVLLLPGFGRVGAQGAVAVSPSASQTFMLQATNEGLPPASSSVTIKVLPRDSEPSQATEGSGPEITSFDAEPSSITAGQPVTLHWLVRGASAVTILPQPGPVPTSGSRTGYPRATTTFTLMATRPGHAPVRATANVQVIQPENPVSEQQRGSQRNSYPGPGAVRNERALHITVLHDHGGAIGGTAGAVGGVLSRLGRRSSSPGNNDYCSGTLSVQNSSISFNGNGDHNFSVPLSSISDVQTNRMPLQGRGAFHIRLNNGENYNFVPQGTSPSQAVAQIRSLLDRDR